MGNNIFTFPIGRNSDFTTVGADVIIGNRYMRRVILELVTPGIADIYINGVAIAVQLPYTGHRYIAPSLDVKPRLPIINGTGIGIFHPKELPRTVQGHKACRVFFNPYMSCIC